MLRTTIFLVTSALAVSGCSSGSSSSPPPPTDPPPQGPEIVRIDLTPKSRTLDVGTRELFTVNAIDSDNGISNVSREATYSLENDSGIVRINSSDTNIEAAIVTAVTPGEDTIIATYEGFTSTADVRVNETTLVSLSVSPESENLPIGAEEQFTAQGEYDDGHTQDLTDESSWSSSDSNVATISEDGLLNAVAAGTTTITASFDGQLDTAIVEVRDPAEVESIAVTPQDVETIIAATEQFTATATYADGLEQSVTDEAVWTSSDTDVISPKSTTPGLFDAISEGTAVITAEFGGNVATTEVSVIQSFVGRTEIGPQDRTVKIGEDLRFFAQAFDSSNNIYDITESQYNEFSVSDTEIAFISNAPGREGILTGRTTGTTLVRSTFVYAGFTYIDETVVTVIP